MNGTAKRTTFHRERHWHALRGKPGKKQRAGRSRARKHCLLEPSVTSSNNPNTRIVQGGTHHSGGLASPPNYDRPLLSDSRSIVCLPAPRQTQDMTTNAWQYRDVTAALKNLLFKLQYDTQLRTSRARNELFSSFVRGSTNIQRAMTRSAGLLFEPRSKKALEPVAVRSRFHPTSPLVIRRRSSATRLPFGGK